jgi:hypothetical protein
MGKLRFHRAALAALATLGACLGLLACTALTGLDGLEEVPCFPPGSCGDASMDSSINDASINDAATDSSTNEASTDGAQTPDSTPSNGADAVALGADGSALDGAPISCDPGTMLCGVGCVSPTDIHYCGSCTNDCTALQHVDLAGSTISCVAGRCQYQCVSGFADCEDAGAGCTTSLEATGSCGACGAACTTASPLCAPTDGGAAAYGCTTSCPAASPTTCMGSCVNEQTSATYCGGCGPTYACATGKTCSSGQCVGPSLSLSPTTYAFVPTTVGQTATQQPFVLKNSGNGASGTLTTAIAGANATEFAIASDGCAGHTLAPNASCTIEVTFTPASRGPRAASLNVNGGAFFAALTGTGQDSVTLTVTKSGKGGGTVSGGPIACGATCSASVTRTSTTDPVVTLSAVPDAGSVFGGWSGACTGTSTTCAVTMSQARTVNAEFDLQPVGLTVVLRAFGTATGSIASSPAGISCTAPCTQTANFPPGTAVTLTSTGGPNVWWGSPACTGSTCAVTVNSASTVTVSLSNNNYVFATSGTFNGNLGGLTGGDALCTQAAKNGGLPGTYVAWLATSTTNALSRLGSARGWIRTDGLPFADAVGTSGGKTGLRNGQIYYPPLMNELGKTNAIVTNQESWTGAGEDGSLLLGTGTVNCNDWSSAASSDLGWNGSQFDGSGVWTNQSEAPCSSTLALYCFGVDLANAVTVAAPTGRIAFLSNGTFTPGGGLAAADTLCQQEASADALPNPTTYLAFLGTATASASSRFNLSGAIWQRPDGAAIVTSASAIVNNLQAAMTQHGDGTYVVNQGSQYAWAGSATASNPGTTASTCSTWSSTSSTSGQTGSAGSTVNWLSSVADPCTSALPIYCFEP